MKKIIGMSIAFFMIFAGCSKQESTDEAIIAKNTLTNFFDNLDKQKFAKALEYFTTDEGIRESLNIYNPDGETAKEDIIENYCQATMTCLKAKIMEIQKVNDSEYVFKVQFIKSDGSLFILWPCCGASEEEMPPTDTFNYTVKNIDNTFKVTTPPLYVP